MHSREPFWWWDFSHRHSGVDSFLWKQYTINYCRSALQTILICMIVITSSHRYQSFFFFFQQHIFWTWANKWDQPLPMSLSQQAIFLYTSSHAVTVIASIIFGMKRASRGISLIPITNSCLDTAIVHFHLALLDAWLPPIFQRHVRWRLHIFNMNRKEYE